MDTQNEILKLVTTMIDRHIGYQKALSEEQKGRDFAMWLASDHAMRVLKDLKESIERQVPSEIARIEFDEKFGGVTA